MHHDIKFGTDGWRAIIGEDFTSETLELTIHATARAFKKKLIDNAKNSTCESSDSSTIKLQNRPVLYIGYDCRENADIYARQAAEIVSSYGFDAILSSDYCPTPALCWNVAHNGDAVGGIMLTSSHNPAEYLGVKLRMEDGGASGNDFTNIVEFYIGQSLEANNDGHTAYEKLGYENTADYNTSVESFLPIVIDKTKAEARVVLTDLMDPYLTALEALVDPELIRSANLKIVVDPMFGAGRAYLASILRKMGCEVCEINNAQDPTFDGLHPEPIPPWIDRGRNKVRELAYDACFFTDGDADRIAAADSKGDFINPHRIIALLIDHMVSNKNGGVPGRVVSTVTSSALINRQCKRLGCEYTTTPVGFKWIYAEMQKGDVLIGGEESGGIGLPDHVMERDGLLMALLLCEMMAVSGKSLGALIVDMLNTLGTLEFIRVGESLSDSQMNYFLKETLNNFEPDVICGLRVVAIDKRDGVKFMLEDDAWLMLRPSGTEPLVRIYAEAATCETLDALVGEGRRIVRR